MRYEYSNFDINCVSDILIVSIIVWANLQIIMYVTDYSAVQDNFIMTLNIGIL
jgi:hypothetical protein